MNNRRGSGHPREILFPGNQDWELCAIVEYRDLGIPILKEKAVNRDVTYTPQMLQKLPHEDSFTAYCWAAKLSRDVSYARP